MAYKKYVSKLEKDARDSDLLYEYEYLNTIGVTIFVRDGKYYWQTRSCAFENIKETINDAMAFLGKSKDSRKLRTL